MPEVGKGPEVVRGLKWFWWLSTHGGYAVVPILGGFEAAHNPYRIGSLRSMRRN
jgi:hypothetical protein